MTIFDEFPVSALPLYRYAQRVGYTECAFFGVSHPDNTQYACREIWSESQRRDVASALSEAQESIESILNYRMMPTWAVNEQYPFSFPLLTKWGKIIALGISKMTAISLGESVDHTVDPAVVMIAFAGTVTTGIRIFYPGTDREIFPSEMSIAGGILTIEIPRCRMVDWLHLENPEEGWDYNDTTLFQADIDIYLEEVDSSVNATLVYPHKCTSSCSSCGCSEYTQSGCGYIDNPEIGKVKIFPATYSAGKWTSKSGCAVTGLTNVRINYRSGLTSLTELDKSMLMRLAHALMPTEPCGCAITQNLWRRDRNIPAILTAERLNCDFGLSDGAWAAWKYANRKALLRFGVL